MSDWDPRGRTATDGGLARFGGGTARYRRLAVALAVFGLACLVGSYALPSQQTVLLSLGAVGVLGALLTLFVIPERPVPAVTARSLQRAVATNGAALASDLDLSDRRIYVPTGRGNDSAVHLFVPPEGGGPVAPGVPVLAGLTTRANGGADRQTRQEDAQASASDDSSGGDARSRLAGAADAGVVLQPAAGELLSEYVSRLNESPARSLDELTEQVADSLVEQFDLARNARVESLGGDTGVTVTVKGSVFGGEPTFDHPAASFLGCGLAHGTGRPVDVETVTTGNRSLEVRCRLVEDDPDSPA